VNNLVSGSYTFQMEWIREGAKNGLDTRKSEEWTGYEKERGMEWIRERARNGMDTRGSQEWNGYERERGMEWIREGARNGMDTKGSEEWNGYERERGMEWIREGARNGMDTRGSEEWNVYERERGMEWIRKGARNGMDMRGSEEWNGYERERGMGYMKKQRCIKKSCYIAPGLRCWTIQSVKLKPPIFTNIISRRLLKNTNTHMLYKYENQSQGYQHGEHLASLQLVAHCKRNTGQMSMEHEPRKCINS
jgi:hypothetical protein